MTTSPSPSTPLVYATCGDETCCRLTVSAVWSPKGYCSLACRNRCKYRRRNAVRRQREQAARLAVFERDNYICHLCNEATDPTADLLSPYFPTVDHVLPRSQGGQDHPDNLRTAHRLCNSRRGVTPVPY